MPSPRADVSTCCTATHLFRGRRCRHCERTLGSRRGFVRATSRLGLERDEHRATRVVVTVSAVCHPVLASTHVARMLGGIHAPRRSSIARQAALSACEESAVFAALPIPRIGRPEEVAESLSCMSGGSNDLARLALKPGAHLASPECSSTHDSGPPVLHARDEESASSSWWPTESKCNSCDRYL